MIQSYQGQPWRLPFLAEKLSVAQSIARVIDASEKKTDIWKETVTLFHGASGIGLSLHSRMPILKRGKVEFGIGSYTHFYDASV